MKRLEDAIPLLRTLRTLDRPTLHGDLVAGLTTGIMLVPQGMAYAMLAGLEPIVGLYAAVVPLVVYAFLGTSGQLAVGPVAMVSLLVASSVGELAPLGSDRFWAYAVLLAALVGVIQWGMGVARLGFLVNFLAHPVVAGFTSAAALIIAVSQLGHLLGFAVRRGDAVHETVLQVLRGLADSHGPTMAVAATSVALLVGLKRWWPAFPRHLAVVVLTTLGAWALSLDAAGVAVVGRVPRGFPTPALPAWDPAALRALLPMALTIAFVGFMESISVAKAFARRHGADLDADQELKALGLANVAGALFGGYAVAGGFGRSAVNAQAGARTGLAGLVTAGVVALTLLFLTPLFAFLPRATLAAIIFVAVLGLVDLAEVRHLWKVSRSDLALMGITFAGTLVLGIEEGILLGVAASLVAFLRTVSRPHYAVLGRLPGTPFFRKLAHHPEAETLPGVLILRVDAPMFFGNTSFLKGVLAELEAASEAPLCAVVLDASSIGAIDASADATLHDLLSGYERRGIALYVAAARGPVRDLLARSGFTERLGAARLCATVDEAVVACGGESPRLALAAP